MALRFHPHLPFAFIVAYGFVTTSPSLSVLPMASGPLSHLLSLVPIAVSTILGPYGFPHDSRLLSLIPLASSSLEFGFLDHYGLGPCAFLQVSRRLSLVPTTSSSHLVGFPWSLFRHPYCFLVSLWPLRLPLIFLCLYGLLPTSRALPFVPMNFSAPHVRLPWILWLPPASRVLFFVPMAFSSPPMRFPLLPLPYPRFPSAFLRP